MNKKLKPLLRAGAALTCTLSLTLSSVIVYADDSVDTLKQQTSTLQDKLDGLNRQLTDLSTEITDLASRIEDTDAAVQKATLDLAAARVNEELQYDAMKKRIKFMYETGNTSLLEIIFTSESMGEFLNNTEFVRNVTEYDRKMLDELKQIHSDIAEKEAALKNEQNSLKEMKDELDQQEAQLTSAITSTDGELKASEEALAQAKAAQAAAAAALKKKQEEAAKDQQNSKPNNKPSDNNQKPGGSGGTIVVPPTEAETNDLVLFAAILQCEAGSSDYNGLLAVATVIMNRVESSRYPNTLREVIYQKGQFSPTWNGSLNRVLERGPATLCYQVAQDALGGARLASVSGCYSFRAASTGHAGTVIGGNVFF